MNAAEATANQSRSIWIDAQLPPSFAPWLASEFNIEVRHVVDLGLSTSDDSVIFDIARSGQAVVIVTKDEDFVQLLDRRGPPPQIVWVTCGNVRNVVLREILGAAWPRVADLLAAGEPLVEVGRRA